MNGPWLYPEHTREALEYMHAALLTAMRFAAQEKVGADPASVEAQLRTWLDQSYETAFAEIFARSYTSLGQVEGTPQ